MRVLLTILIIPFSIVCFAQTTKMDFVLTLEFAPSFIIPCDLTIFSKEDSNSIELTVYKNWDKKELYLKKWAPLAKSEIKSFADFLKTYKFQIKGSIDTVKIHKVFIDGDSVTLYSISTGNDGITVNGTFTQSDFMNKFAFWSPEKATQNHQLIELIFSVLYKSFSEEKTVNYIEQLEGYFSFGLGLKKISDNPLKYKIYGSISSNE